MIVMAVLRKDYTMKILVNADVNLKQISFWIDYLRDVCPYLLEDVILIDLSNSEEIKRWASEQRDFTYVYFEEEIMFGCAYNKVIRELEINDDILITDCYHIPLADSYDRMLKAFSEKEDSFAIGPVSNTFGWEQYIKWNDAEAALDWSIKCKEEDLEEVLMLEPGVVLFRKHVINSNKTFYDEVNNIDDMVTEKCIREFLGHQKMYVCNCSGFWDVRGNEYKRIYFPDIDMLERRFNMHYLNVHGNDWIMDLLVECDDLSDDIRVLEVGCDCGGTLFQLKKHFKNAKLYGTDINEGSLRFASEFAEVKINNIEEYNLVFENNRFDIIIFGDVLEHLRDPLGTLRYCRNLLNKGGRIATSIPNLMNIEVMKYLLNGDFPYSDFGLLDKTHIHMFTYNEIIKMFTKEAGFSIEKIAMNGAFSGNDEKLAEILVKLGKAEKFMYQAYQYQIVARMH